MSFPCWVGSTNKTTNYLWQSYFRFPGHHYEFLVTLDGEVMFQRTYGNGTDKLGYDHSGTKLFGNTRNPAAVFRAALLELKKFVFAKRPPHFYFTAMEDKRKELYERIAADIEKETRYRCLSKENGYYIFQRSSPSLTK